MTPAERVRAALVGGQVDRPPFSLWGHDYVREWSAEGLADATIERYEAGRFDFVKINPRFTYFVEDWGATFERGPDRPRPLSWPVRSPGDFRRLEPLDPDAGALGEQMRALELIGERLPRDVPFIQTIFNPLSVARNLVGEDTERLLTFIADDPEAVHAGLEVITETYARYATTCLERGAAGIFFATTRVGTYEALSRAQYEAFAMPYDLRVLAAVSAGWFNVMHVCQDHTMLDVVADYPVAAFSWSATSPTNPDLSRGHTLAGKAVMGGVSEKTTLVRGTPEAIAEEVRAAIAATGGRWLLVAPGCSIPPETPLRNIQAVRDAVEAARDGPR